MRLALGALAVLLLLWGCGSRRSASIEIDPALARLVPPDAVALAGVRIDVIRATSLYRKYLAKRVAATEAQDVSEILIASNGKDFHVFAKTKSGVAHFDERGRKSDPSRSYGGVPAALRERLQAIPSEAQMWAAGIGAVIPPSALPQEGNFANLQNLLIALERWTAWVDLRSGLKMDASAVYRTEQDARQIHDALRGLLGLVRLSTPDNAPELLRLYDGIRISMEKSNVRISAEISADILEKSLEQLNRLSGSFGSSRVSPPPRPR